MAAITYNKHYENSAEDLRIFRHKILEDCFQSKCIMGRPKIIVCKLCREEKEHVAKGMCNTCYKRTGPPKIECKRCKKIRPHHAKGYCSPCYVYVFHMDSIQDWNYKRWHGLTKEEHDKITGECAVCGFKQVVDLHHIDKNRKNRSPENLVGLCPNHHKMIHMIEYSEEIKDKIREKKVLKALIFS